MNKIRCGVVLTCISVFFFSLGSRVLWNMPRDGEFGDAKRRLGALTDMWSRQQGRRWRGGRIAVRRLRRGDEAKAMLSASASPGVRPGLWLCHHRASLVLYR